MLEPDNHILSLHSLYSFYTSSAVINSATGESADSGKRWTSLHAYLFLSLGICIHCVTAGVRACGSSQGEISLNNRFAWRCLLKKDIPLPSFCFLCPSAETLSACVNEKSADSQLHTAALQFLITIFTEETKNRSVEVTASNCQPAPTLCDVIRGPPAGQLCDLLLQVCRTHFLRVLGILEDAWISTLHFKGLKRSEVLESVWHNEECEVASLYLDRIWIKVLL